MPDPIIPPPQPTSNVYIPTGETPKVTSSFDDWKNTQQLNDLGSSGAEYAKSISYGESITDLINDVENLQSQSEDVLNQYTTGGIPNSPGSFDPNAAYQGLSEDLSKKSLQAFAKPVTVGTEEEYNRYKDSKDFQTFGYNSALGEEQEHRYGRAMTWGDTIGKALGGGAHLAADTFVEGWKGWGRMASALFTWDSSKLMGTEEERYAMAKEQNDVMNKYAIYDDDTSKDGYFNRQFFGTMLQQSGFAVGAALQFATEEFLTGGLGTVFEGMAAGMLVGRVAKTAAEIRAAAGVAEKTTFFGRAAERAKGLFRPKMVETASDLKNATRKVMNTVTNQPKVINSLVEGLKKLTPGYGTVEELIKLRKAGAGFAQLSFTGVGGIKRGLSEFNMARSEAIFEAAGTYKQLEDSLINDYTKKNGKEPEGADLEKIKQSAEDASHDNFWTNIGVLSVSNRIMFDNMFKGFSKSRSLLGEGVASLKGEGISVTAKNLAGTVETRAFKKGLLGGFSAVGQVAKVFGKKEAAWVATKSIGKGLMKFEGSEGMQELIQTASDVGLEQYYSDLYHGKKGYSTKMDAILDSMQNPFTDTQGMKTFLMGALTGRLIAPMSSGFTAISTKIGDMDKIKAQAKSAKNLMAVKIANYTEQNGKAPEGDDLETIKAEVARTVPEYQTQKQKVDEAIKMMNILFADPQWLQKEALANIKVNNLAAANMDEAAANHDQYVFNNSKDSALAKTIAAAIKLDMYDSLRDVIKEYGINMTDAEFKQAFGIEATKDNKKNIDSLTKNMVSNIEDYYETFKKLQDKYKDTIIPELYKNNTPEVYANAQRQKTIVDNIIEMIATNSFKAKAVIKRANALQTEIAANENIGASSMEVLTKLGNDLALNGHVKMLEKEIAAFEKGENQTPEQREIYKDQKEELRLVTMWAENRGELINEAKVDKSYTAFSSLINLYNKRAKIATTVSKIEVEDAFLKFTDYIKLNNDHGEYVDAMNLLADPKNMKLVANAELSAMNAFKKKWMMEYLQELAKGTGIPEEEIIKHTYEKQEDGTWTVFDHEGMPVNTGVVTEEEAKRIAEEKTAKQAEERAKEDAESLINVPLTEEERKAEIEKTNDEIIRLTNLRVNDPIVAKAIKDFNAQLITVEELDAVYKKWDDENGLTEAIAKLEELKKEPPPVLVVRPELQSVLDKIKIANNDLELVDALEHMNEIFGDVEPTKEEEDIILKAYKARQDELKAIEAAAIKAGRKLVSKTSPEFTKPYNEVLVQMETIINNPNVTLSDIDKAFSLLVAPLSKLEKADRNEFIVKHLIEKNALIESVKNEIASKNVQLIKDNITKMLSTDNLPVGDTVTAIFNELNLILKPEFKDEVIAHFEEEYLKAVDRKINKLTSQINTGVDNPVLQELLEIKNSFKDALDKNLQNLKITSAEIKAQQTKIGTYLVTDNTSFSTPTNRSIQLSTFDRDASETQAMVIQSFIDGGLLSEAELRREQSSTRKGASTLINRAIGRMFTIQINNAIAEFHKNGNSASLEKALLDYLKEVDVSNQTEKEQIQTVQNIIAHIKSPEQAKETDQELLDDINGLFKSNIPLVKDVTTEEYKLFEELRKTVSTILREGTMMEMFNYTERQQRGLVAEGKAPINKLFPDELLKYLERFLKKDPKTKQVDFKSFQEAFIKAYQEIRESTDPAKTNDVIVNLVATHMSRSKNNIQLIQSLMAYGIQTENLTKTDDGDVTPLTDIEMIDVINNPTRSLNKTQIAQVETFAKTEQLTNHKKILKAAVGYKSDPISYTGNLLEDTVVNSPFSSLRPKSSEDNRSLRDLLLQLKVTDNGTKTTMKNALQFILNSEHATATEKALATKLIDIVGDDEFITINNDLKDAGEYNPNTNVVSINVEAASYKEKDGVIIDSNPLETVILHELIHALTAKAISDPTSDYYKGLKAVFDFVKSQPGASTFYAFLKTLEEDEQLNEFVTEAFTNPAFQYMLSKLSYKNTNTSVWDKFLEFIGNLFKALGIDISNTALSEVLSLTEGVINENATTKKDEFPSEAIMESIKNASTKDELLKIRNELEANKDKYTPAVYKALNAAINKKSKSITAIEKFNEITKDLQTIKIGKSTYRYTNQTGSLQVFKVRNYKLEAVTDKAILDEIQAKIDKENPPPPPPPPSPTDIENVTTPTNFTITSELSNAEYIDDPNSPDITTIDDGQKSITAKEPYALRSKGDDGKLVVNPDGSSEFVENPDFVNYYNKIRTIINKLSTLPLDKLGNWFVTIDNDAAGLRWDGSAGEATKNVIGYISDENGNPIVFDKEGNAIGRADKNDPGNSRFNTGDNQIVYFNTATETDNKKGLAAFEQESLKKLFEARKAAKDGKPQIAKITKISAGQMNLKGLVKPSTKNQKNTARDQDLRDMLDQDHVSLQLNKKGDLVAVITDGNGGTNTTALFPPSSRAIKLSTPDGEFTLFEHLVELMKVYHELKAAGYTRLGDIEADLNKFVRNIWFTGSKANLEIHKSFNSFTIRTKNSKTGEVKEQTLSIFDNVNGVMIVNENNLKRVAAHINNTKLNVYKSWLDGSVKFKFPFITKDESGARMINFEEKDYKNFIIKEVGVITYINDIPAQGDIKRYNSNIQFEDPTDLEIKPSGVIVDEKKLIDDPKAMENAVNDAVKNNTPATGKKIPSTKNKIFKAPKFDKNYEKIC